MAISCLNLERLHCGSSLSLLAVPGHFTSVLQYMSTKDVYIYMKTKLVDNLWVHSNLESR